MTRTSSTGICATLTKVAKDTKPFDWRIVAQLDDDRVSANRIAFSITDDIYFPFQAGDEVVIRISRVKERKQKQE